MKISQLNQHTTIAPIFTVKHWFTVMKKRGRSSVQASMTHRMAVTMVTLFANTFAQKESI